MIFLGVVNINRTEEYLSDKLRELERNFKTENTIIMKRNYTEVENESLKNIFSIIHGNLNSLFSFMNSKNLVNSHYNADASRKLIEIIEQTFRIQAVLREYGEYSFEIVSYYEEIMNKCKDFLQHSGGSPIPKDFTKINIIEHKPIFRLLDSVQIQSLSTKSSSYLKIIGHGSYANVFKYKDPHYNFPVVVKRAFENLRDDELERFKYEYKHMKKLDSPFIIKAYNYNEDKNEYTMEYANKKTLKDYCKLADYL